MYTLSPASGSTHNIFNNVIGDIKAPAGSSGVTAGSSRVRGLWIAATSSPTNVNVFNNTVYLNATSTAVPFAFPGSGRKGVRVAVEIFRAMGSPHCRNQVSGAG